MSVFQHPQNGSRVKYIGIEDVLVLNEFNNFLFIAWAKDIIKGLKFIDG